jgi:hypothetical protein
MVLDVVADVMVVVVVSATAAVVLATVGIVAIVASGELPPLHAAATRASAAAPARYFE